MTTVVAQASEHERPEAVRVAHRQELVVGEDQQRVGALDAVQGFDEAPGQIAVLGAGHEVDDDLGVHGRLEDRPFVLEVLADVDGVDEVAVVGHGDRPEAGLDDERLGVLDLARPRGRVPVVADGVVAGELAQHVAVEDVRDQPHRPVREQVATVRGDDAGALLAAVLQRVQTEVGQIRGLRVPVDAADTAFLAKLQRHRNLPVREMPPPGRQCAAIIRQHGENANDPRPRAARIPGPARRDGRADRRLRRAPGSRRVAELARAGARLLVRRGLSRPPHGQRRALQHVRDDRGAQDAAARHADRRHQPADRPAHPGAGERSGTVRRGPHRRSLPGGGAGTRVSRGGCRARDPRGRPAGLGLRAGRRGAPRSPGTSLAAGTPAVERASRRRCEAHSRSRSAPSRSRATPARWRHACRCRRAQPGCCRSRTTAAPGGACGSAGTTSELRGERRGRAPSGNSDSPASSCGRISAEAAAARRAPGWRGRRGASAAVRPPGR